MPHYVKFQLNVAHWVSFYIAYELQILSHYWLRIRFCNPNWPSACSDQRVKVNIGWVCNTISQRLLQRTSPDQRKFEKLWASPTIERGKPLSSYSSTVTCILLFFFSFELFSHLSHVSRHVISSGFQICQQT